MTSRTLAVGLAVLVGVGLVPASGTSDEAPMVAQLDAPSNADGAAGDEVGAEPEVDQIIDRVQAYYDAIEAYHADFQQTYTNLALGESLESSGHVYFLKPGRMRWDYATPEPRYLISNGSVLWTFEPEFNQAARVDLSSSEYPTAIRFLMGEGNLRTDFEITRVDCEAESAFCLELVPRISEGQYRSLLFVVDATEFRVRETAIVDPVGSTNRFVFSNVVTSDPLPPANFEFEPTPDMRVLTP